jgi:ribonuclease HI
MGLKEVNIWTDGACHVSTTKVGGWGVVLEVNGKTKTLAGAQQDTTNNAMEITAAIRGLDSIKDKTWTVCLYSDSAYLINCLGQKWYKKWRYNGWLTSKGTPVQNRSLWEILIKIVETFPKIKFIHVNGHAGVEYNEMADGLATGAITKMEKELGLLEPQEEVPEGDYCGDEDIPY